MRENFTYIFKACRGAKGVCPNSLLDGRRVSESIESVITNSIQIRKAGRQIVDGASVHPRFRVALAACPNACTEPQIKDIGIIAIVSPTEVGANCSGCGECEKVCREEAINVVDGRAQIQKNRCVACGQCLGRCQKKILRSSELRFRILVGGRMGRHPRWAEELCVVDSSVLARVIRSLLERIVWSAGNGERAANVVERTGLAGLREKVLLDVRRE